MNVPPHIAPIMRQIDAAAWSKTPPDAEKFPESIVWPGELPRGGHHTNPSGRNLRRTRHERLGCNDLRSLAGRLRRLLPGLRPRLLRSCLRPRLLPRGRLLPRLPGARTVRGSSLGCEGKGGSEASLASASAIAPPWGRFNASPCTGSFAPACSRRAAVRRARPCSRPCARFATWQEWRRSPRDAK